MARRPAKSPNASGGSWGVAPQMNAGLRFADIGSTGLRAFSGWVREEFLPQLVGRQGARVYREMGDNSPIVGAVLFAITAVMRKVEWRTVPKDDSPEAQALADFCDSLRFDMSHTWEDFVVEALSMLRYGYAPHEIVYKLRAGKRPFGAKQPSSKFSDGKIGWARLPLRGQETILKWFFDENGAAVGMTQQPWASTIVDIPMEKMLLFRPAQHKGNPEGYSILRTSYRSYYFIKRLEEQEAVLFERLSGIPVVKLPNALLEAATTAGPFQATAAASIAQWKKIVTNLRIDEQMGLLIPSDTFPGASGPSNVPMFEFKLETPQAGRANLDANTPIARHKQDILYSTMTDFILMGHTTRGAQNLAATKVDLFMGAVEGWLNAMAAVINRHGIPRVLALNGEDDDLAPEFVPDMAQRIDLDQLSNYVLRLSQAGMPLFPDPDLQNFMRDAAGLPESEQDDDDFATAEADAAGANMDPDKIAAAAKAKEDLAGLAKAIRAAKEERLSVRGARIAKRMKSRGATRKRR